MFILWSVQYLRLWHNYRCYIVIDWICFLLFGSENYSSHNFLVWLRGFGGNHSILFFVQYCHHHIETRQIQITPWSTGRLSSSYIKSEKSFKASNRAPAQACTGFVVLLCSLVLNKLINPEPCYSFKAPA